MEDDTETSDVDWASRAAGHDMCINRECALHVLLQGLPIKRKLVSYIADVLSDPTPPHMHGDAVFYMDAEYVARLEHKGGRVGVHK